MRIVVCLNENGRWGIDVLFRWQELLRKYVLHYLPTHKEILGKNFCFQRRCRTTHSPATSYCGTQFICHPSPQSQWRMLYLCSQKEKKHRLQISSLFIRSNLIPNEKTHFFVKPNVPSRLSTIVWWTLTVSINSDVVGFGLLFVTWWRDFFPTSEEQPYLIWCRHLYPSWSSRNHWRYLYSFHKLNIYYYMLWQ